MLSVIVPIYNAAPYLKKCVDSICNQTYTDMEIILVDDGSKDGGYEICERYAREESRVRVIHKENGGVVSARKAGVCAAKGDFIGWVDSDDWIEEDYFEKLVAVQRKSGADIVAAGHYHDIGKNSIKVFNNISSGCYSKEEILSRVIYSGEFFEYGVQPHLWNKLIRRDIMESVGKRIDDSISIGDDVLFVYPGIKEAKKICITDICAYHYVQHADSLTKKRQKPEQMKLNILLEGLRNMKENSMPEYRLDFQLIQYEKAYNLLHQYSVLEKSKFPPYGKIPDGSRIVIYGAGAMGRSVYQYYLYKKEIQITAWIDSNWKDYNDLEFVVRPPGYVKELNDKYDFILIANTRKKAAENMGKYIESLGVSRDKVRWLTSEFIDNPRADWKVDEES